MQEPKLNVAIRAILGPIAISLADVAFYVAIVKVIKAVLLCVSSNVTNTAA